jgi:hypothetical protein
MIGELLGERQRLAHQAGDALTQRVVEPLDVIGFAGQRADRLMLRGGNHSFVHDVLICIKCRVLPISRRNLRPQALGTRAAAVTDVKGNHLTRRGVHGDPNPLLVRVLRHEAAHFICFHLQASDHDVAVTSDGLDMEMLRQCLEALDEKTQKPLECDPHCATNAPQGKSPFHQQTFDERPPGLSDKVLLAALDELASTVVAVVILPPVVNVPIFLILGGLAPRTHISDDHGLLLTSTGWVTVFGSKVTQKSVGEHYMDITTFLQTFQ